MNKSQESWKMKCAACGHEGDDFFAIRIEDDDVGWLPIVIYRGNHEPEGFSYEAYQARLYMCPRCGVVRVGRINGLDTPREPDMPQAQVKYKVVRLPGLLEGKPGAAERAEERLNKQAAEGWQMSWLIGEHAILEKWSNG